MIESLSLAESTARDHYERQIAAGIGMFIAVGEALLAIRDQRLYRSSHASFAAYLAERWPQLGSRRQADRLINAALVEGNLRPAGLSLPSERVARELAGLEPEAQRAVLRQAVSVAGGHAPTTARCAPSCGRSGPSRWLSSRPAISTPAPVCSSAGWPRAAPSLEIGSGPRSYSASWSKRDRRCSPLPTSVGDPDSM